MQRISRWQLTVALVLSAAMIGILIFVGDYFMALVVAVVATVGTLWQVKAARTSLEPDEPDEAT